MENEFLLTIAIPTYKRAPFLDSGLSILHEQIKDKQYPIEIVVSDNCSPDNTDQIVQKHIAEGMPIRYVCNEKNLGMDGNFVNCFKLAKGKYCWVLGDDDYLMDGALDEILPLLEKEDCGLLHLKAANHTTEDPVIYKNHDKYVRSVGYWFTFISSNIVNTQYVKSLDFDKYMGTFFTLVPLYITAACKAKINILYNKPTLQVSLDGSTNGGYNLFEVFANNFNNIIKEFAQKKYYSYSTYRYLKINILKYVLCYYIGRYLVNKEDSGNFKIDDAWNILFRQYRFYPQFYIQVGKLYCRKMLK